MSDSGVIREFLVRLGFKVDDASQGKFKEGVNSATKEAEKLNKEAEKAGKSAIALGAAILATGAVVGRSAFNLATKLEDLHFASQRTGAAASSLKAVAMAAKEVGATSEEALSSIEGVASFMRNNPAGESYIASLGVQTRNANGELRDTVDIVNDLGKELSKKPQFLANQYGKMLGINENYLRGMRNEQYFAEFGKYKKDYVDSGVDKRSGQAHGLMGTWRSLVAGAEGKLGTVGLWGVGAGATAAGSALAFAAAKSAIQQSVGRAVGAGIAEAAAKTGTGVAGKAALSAAEAGGLRLGVRRVLGLLGPVGTFIMGMTESKDLNVGEAEDLARRRKLGMTLTDADGNTTNGNAPPQDSKKTPSLAETPFGRLIARGEGDYSSVNFGKAGGYKSGRVELGDMTVDEVMRAQRNGQFNAAGRYQIIKGTLAKAVEALGLNGNEKFDQSTQDRIFEEYLVKNKRSAIGDYLSGKSDNVRSAMRAAAKEWASVADPSTGKSYYAGMANNKASITVAEMEQALRNSRTALGVPDTMVAQQPRNVTIDARSEVTISLQGSADPSANAKAIANEQTGVNQQLTRNLQGALS
ncbi:glucosaminidase [Pandoraea communis]|uniref:glucosaminidase n=1 Tax=Pandoraea communis TaxID=2508297 RepID=UPI0025A60EDF|nr:glucosaminidase [Pandoraea communis]MDM8357473.1 glucosaminidase [Pandoraea communis]